MSNITADHTGTDLIKVIDAGFIPVLSQIASHQNFDIRKEVFYMTLLFRPFDFELNFDN
jgi:hypothetical protein